MTMTELTEKIWDAIGPSMFISRSEFMASLEEWEITPREIDGEVVGATMVKGPEFHFVTFGSRKAFSRALVAELLEPIIAEHGFVRTRTPRDDARQRRFNIRIGFHVEAIDEFFTTFRMERLSLHGGASCRS